MLKFLIQIEGKPERTVECEGETADAGSDSSLPIHIEDTAAEARHFRIEARPDGVILKDLGTDSGTKVNGSFVSQVRLAVGDLIEVGAAKVIFALEGAAAQAPAVKIRIGGAAPPAPAPAAAKPAARPMAVGAAAPRVVREPRKRSAANSITVLVLLLVGVGATFLLIDMIGPKDEPRSHKSARVTPAEGTAEVVAEGPVVEKPADFVPTVVPGEAIPVPESESETEGGAVARPNRPDDPEPSGAVARAAREKKELEARVEAARRERERALTGARENLAAFEGALPERIDRYAFAGPIRDLEALAEATPASPVQGEMLGRIDDLRRAERVLARLKEALSSEKNAHLTLASGLELVVTAADEEGFDAKVSGATTRKKWTELHEATIHDELARRGSYAEEWLDLSAFANLYGLEEDWEVDLVRAHRKDQGMIGAISDILARRRGIAVPAGGFVLHQGAWVTPTERGYLEQGLVQHDGRWMTRDEAMAARGFKLHEGRWLSPEDYEDVLEAQREEAALAKKYLPKGIIDKPGQTEPVPWDRAFEKKTPHYRVKTNLSKDAADDIAYTMEILRSNLSHVFGLRGKGATFTINVAADRNDYRSVWPRAGSSLGFCSTSEICTFYQPPMTTAVLMHEGTHQMVRRLLPSCPRWLHEGLATYFECSRFKFNAKKRSVELEVGLLNANRLMNFQRELQTGAAVSLETFLRGQGGNPYHQGWALVYYLAKGADGKYSKRLYPFGAEAHKRDVVERFQKIFRIRDLRTWEEEWHAWIKSLKPTDGVDMRTGHR